MSITQTPQFLVDFHQRMNAELRARLTDYPLETRIYDQILTAIETHKSSNLIIVENRKLSDHG